MLLVQGRNLKLNPSNEGERLFLKNAEHEYEGTVVASTRGTIDATFPSDMVPGVYDLWIHGRTARREPDTRLGEDRRHHREERLREGEET